MSRNLSVSKSTVLRRFASVLAIVAVLGLPALTSAGIIVKIEDRTITSHPVNPVTGYFDVYVEYDGTPAGAQIGAYNFRADLDGTATGIIQLNEAVESNTVYASGRAPHFPGQNPSEFNTLPAQFIQVADNLPGIGAQTPIVHSRALGTVKFTVQPGASGVFPVLFNQGGNQETFLFDGQSNPHTIELVTGSIRIIPEPSGVLLATLLVTGLMQIRRRK